MSSISSSASSRSMIFIATTFLDRLSRLGGRKGGREERKGGREGGREGGRREGKEGGRE